MGRKMGYSDLKGNEAAGPQQTSAFTGEIGLTGPGTIT